MKKQNLMRQLGLHADKHKRNEMDVVRELESAFNESPLSWPQKTQAFLRYVRRQDVARFLTKYELFKQCVSLHGNVVECGVFTGNGLMGWMHFSSIMEPYNHSRRIIGFDTFAGFPGFHTNDKAASDLHRRRAFKTGGDMEAELGGLIRIHDGNRPLGHIPKVEMVRGDACRTIPRYLKTHRHLLISLLYLDFDLYAPTKAALRHLYPRVVKGGVVAFDELNCPEFPGETIALMETLSPGKVHLRRLPYDPQISYFIKE